MSGGVRLRPSFRRRHVAPVMPRAPSRRVPASRRYSSGGVHRRYGAGHATAVARRSGAARAPHRGGQRRSECAAARARAARFRRSAAARCPAPYRRSLPAELADGDRHGDDDQRQRDAEEHVRLEGVSIGGVHGVESSPVVSMTRRPVAGALSALLHRPGREYGTVGLLTSRPPRSRPALPRSLRAPAPRPATRARARVAGPPGSGRGRRRARCARRDSSAGRRPSAG